MYVSEKNPAHPALVSTATGVANFFSVHKAQHVRAPLIATSGGYDPLHLGHTRCIQGSALLKGENGLLVVIVNDDGFLLRKKGYVFMPIEERLELIAAIRGVDFVVPWDDGTQFVTEAIKVMRPTVFAKGGDRSTAENVPEYDTCVKIGCNVVFGIGGSEKIQSSSDLVRKYE